MPYAFTLQRPPLFSEIPTILEAPPASLQRDVGHTTWQDEKLTGALMNSTRHREATFDATRFYRWMITSGPSHYAEDETRKTKAKRGLSQEVLRRVEATLMTKLKLGHSLFSASIDQSLKLTNEERTKWFEEHEEERTVTFKGGHTYVFWHLFDTVVLKCTSSEIWKNGHGEITNRNVPATETITIDVAIGDFVDKCSDQEREMYNKNEEAARKQREPRDLRDIIRMPISWPVD